MAVHRFSSKGQKVISFIESTLGIHLDPKNSKLIAMIEEDALKMTDPNKVPEYDGALADYYADFAAQSVNDQLLGLYESTIKNASDPQLESDAFAKALVLARGLNEFAPDVYKKYGLKTFMNLAKQGM